ncbi:MAG: transketolase family protein [Culicoidibacterales bacterium]
MFKLKPEKAGKEMRQVFSDTLIELIAENSKIIALEGDLGGASSFPNIQKVYPNNFLNVGIAEANMIGIASGLSLLGHVPFIHTFAPFATRRALDQLYVSGVYSDGNFKIYGSDPGVCAATNGGTHATFEDIAIMTSLPKTMVFDPADEVQLKWLIKEISTIQGVQYIRCTRKSVPKIYAEGSTFQIGKANLLKEGTDVLVLSMGELLFDAYEAATELENEGIKVCVIDTFSLKPFDKDTIVQHMKDKKLVVTFENHSIYGGLGSLTAMCIAQNGLSNKLLTIGVDNEASEVGSIEYLKERFGLTKEHLKAKIRENIL